jgi:hypothetical protein
MLLTKDNWKGVWLGALILSQKLWSDNPMSTATFAALVQPVTEKQLRAVESKFFSLIKMVTSVKPSQYAEVRRDVRSCGRISPSEPPLSPNSTVLAQPQYYFELRQLFTDIATSGPSEWALKPLTVVQGKRLLHRSSRPVLRHQKTPVSGDQLSAEEGRLTAPRNLRRLRLYHHLSQLSSLLFYCSGLPKNASLPDGGEGLRMTLEDVTLANTSRYVIS